jgi:hypothetical protein
MYMMIRKSWLGQWIWFWQGGKMSPYDQYNTLDYARNINVLQARKEIKCH